MRAFGQIIIYLFIILNASRVFFSKHIKKDSMVILAPLSCVLAFLNILAYGLHGISIQLFAIASLSVVINIHALLRYSEKLFIDRFSLVMKGFCAVIILFSIISGIFLLANSPVEVKRKSLKIKVTNSYYEGSFRNGFTSAEIFSKKTAYFTEYRKTTIGNNPRNVIVFVADKRGDSPAYKPYLELLANNGFIVCTCDFYTDDSEWGILNNDRIRRSFELTQKSLKEDPYKDNRTKYEYNVTNECKALLPILEEHYGQNCTYFFVADGIASKPVKEFVASLGEKVCGSFYLDTIPEFTTTGYGCIDMTNPFIAHKLDVKKDKTAFIPKYLAKKTTEAIYEAWGLR